MDKEEKKQPKGRPSTRPSSREEAVKQANDLLEEYNKGVSSLNLNALRRRINTLGENPKNPTERYFSFSGGVKTTPKIVEYKKPNIRTEKTKVKDLINELDEMAKDFEETDYSESKEKPKEKPSKIVSAFSSMLDLKKTGKPKPKPKEKSSSSLQRDMPQRRPEISELMDSSIERVENVEQLNQNILGINENSSRSSLHSITDDIYQRASRLTQGYVERGLSSLIPQESKYDIQAMADNMSSSVKRVVDNVIESKYGEVRTRLNMDPDIEESMRSLAVNRLQEVASSLGMRLPSEVLSMGSDTLERLFQDADINIDIEDVKTALSSVDMEDLSQGFENIPFGSIIQAGGEILSNKYPMIKTIANITDKIPESLKNKIIQAGGGIKDVLKIRGEQKEGKERKEEKEGKTYQIPSVSDIFGRVQPDDSKNPSSSTQPEKDQRSLLIDEINNINLRLEDIARGKRTANTYPQRQETTDYRFPKPDENFNAVPLVQNAMTNYLNDLNLYGSSDINYNEI